MSPTDKKLAGANSKTLRKHNAQNYSPDQLCPNNTNLKSEINQIKHHGSEQATWRRSTWTGQHISITQSKDGGEENIILKG
eukprot:scaffold225280_cov15-Tisochrysis_lutea.AAC.1